MNQDVTTVLILENEVYGDLLLEQVPVEDSYYNLLQKFESFLSWLSLSSTFFKDVNYLQQIGQNPKYFFPFEFVVMCDDDVYINSSYLDFYIQKSAKTRFYAGEVF